MCGKFTQYASWQDVHAFSQPLVIKKDTDQAVVSTPMRTANIMWLNAAGEREMVSMRWGFAGRDDPNPTRPKHMHVRAETIDQRRTFAQAFATSRGILMVHTFNEGEELPSGKTKQWVVTPNDGQPIAIAVIFEEWQNGPETLLTFVMVDDAGQHVNCSHHRPHAGDPSQEWMGDLARRNTGVVTGGQGAAAHLRGWRQLDDGAAGAHEGDKTSQATRPGRAVLG
jgi:putative SOS response-associated peptidase YedK